MGEADSELREDLIKFKRLFVVLLFIVALLLFGNSSFFTVKTVTVKGNVAIPNEDILVAAGIRLGQNLFQINTRQIKQTLLRNPRILKIIVSRHLPDAIKITIQERTPACLVSFQGTPLLVATDGVVLENGSADQNRQFPLVTGLHIKQAQIGKRLQSYRLQTALDIIGFADRNLRRLLQEIDLKNNCLRLILPNSGHTVEVVLGTEADLDKKIANLRAILANTALKEINRIDLRVVELPTVINN